MPFNAETVKAFRLISFFSPTSSGTPYHSFGSSSYQAEPVEAQAPGTPGILNKSTHQ